VCILLVSLIGVVGSIWASREEPSASSDQERVAFALRGSMMGRSIARRGLDLPPPVREEQALDLTASPVLGTARPDPASGRPSLPLLGEIVPCCAVAGDPHRGLLLAGTREGTLLCYDAKSLRRLGSCRLPQPAYRLALDGPRGLLYAASTPQSSLLLGPLGDRERASGDLHVYDLAEIVAQPGDRAGFLRPLRTFALDAQVQGMILTPEGDYLYVLTETSKKAQVERIDTRRWISDRSIGVQLGGSAMLAQSPGGALYVLSGGRLYALDPQSWTILRDLRVGASVLSVLAGKNDRLYVLERREGLFLHLYDVRAAEVLGHLTLWPSEAIGRVYLRMSPDGSRIYAGNSAVTHGAVREVDVSGEQGLPRLLRDASTDPHHLLRGPLMLGPDARYAVTGSGHVFRLAS
jgi:hypothetical protein